MSRLNRLVGAFLCAGACALAAAGCGSGGGSSSADSSTAGKSDAVQVLELGSRYIDGIVKSDWDEVCGTRTDAEQARLKEASGSCTTSLETAFKASDEASLLKGAQPQSVELEGDRATFSIRTPKGALPGRLHAIKENGEWKLFDPEGSAAP